LEVAVPESLDKWEDRHPNLFDLDGNVLGITMRNIFHVEAQDGIGETLRLEARGFRSARLVDQATSEFARIRRWPRDPRTKIRRRGVEFPPTLFGSDGPPENLFGPDMEARGLMLAIIWDLDFKTRALVEAALALVQHIDIPRKATVFSAIPLPTAPSISPPEPDPRPPDDFEDHFGDEPGFGPTPA
jgi:hypothetical protein